MDNLAVLLDKFLTEVAKKDIKDVLAGMNDFFAGIDKMEEAELMAGWKSLQFAKIKVSDNEADKKKMELISIIEENLKERMYILSDALDFTIGMDLREKFTRLTGDKAFFSGERLPKITTEGGNSSNGDGLTKEKAQNMLSDLRAELLREIKLAKAEAISKIPSSSSSKTSGWVKVAIPANFLLIIGLIILGYFMNPIKPIQKEIKNLKDNTITSIENAIKSNEKEANIKFKSVDSTLTKLDSILAELDSTTVKVKVPADKKAKAAEAKKVKVAEEAKTDTTQAN